MGAPADHAHLVIGGYLKEKAAAVGFGQSRLRPYPHSLGSGAFVADIQPGAYRGDVLGQMGLYQAKSGVLHQRRHIGGGENPHGAAFQVSGQPVLRHRPLLPIRAADQRGPILVHFPLPSFQQSLSGAVRPFSGPKDDNPKAKRV